MLRSDRGDVTDALGDIAANVDDQVQQLSDARAAVTAAEEQLALADLAVADTESRLAGPEPADRRHRRRRLHEPAGREWRSTPSAARSLTDLSVKQSILNTKATTDAETLEMYQEADAQLETEKSERAALAETMRGQPRRRRDGAEPTSSRR